ncbi:MAG: hypothetical protein H6R27_1060 [Proteobacteria bacterium]|nr:hypothetical protein [Pseudomonadota bacterium]
MFVRVEGAGLVPLGLRVSEMALDRLQEGSSA